MATGNATVSKETANSILATVQAMRSSDTDITKRFEGTYGLKVTLSLMVYNSGRREIVALMDICGVNVQAWDVYDAELFAGEIFLYATNGAPMTIPVKGVE